MSPSVHNQVEVIINFVPLNLLMNSEKKVLIFTTIIRHSGYLTENLTN